MFAIDLYNKLEIHQTSMRSRFANSSCEMGKQTLANLKFSSFSLRPPRDCSKKNLNAPINRPFENPPVRGKISKRSLGGILRLITVAGSVRA